MTVSNQPEQPTTAPADDVTPDTQAEAEVVAASEGPEPATPTEPATGSHEATPSTAADASEPAGEDKPEGVAQAALGAITKVGAGLLGAIADKLGGGDQDSEDERQDAPAGTRAEDEAPAEPQPQTVAATEAGTEPEAEALAGDQPTAVVDDAVTSPTGTAPERPETADASAPATPEAAERPEVDEVAPPAMAGAEIPPVEEAEAPAVEADAPAEEAPVPAAQPSPTPVATAEAATTPAAARPAVPSPAAMPRPATRPGTPTPAAVATPSPAVAPPSTPSNSATFGRVAEDGTVFVRTPDGERAVGSYPGASADEALAYFARKYDEMWAAAELLYHRVLQTGLASKEASADLAKLREHIGEANVVGDLPELDAKVESIATAIEARKQVEATERAAAREQAKAERETIVAEAERIAAQDPAKTQWKQSGARIRELLEEWKQHQRSSAKLDRETENSLWQRFSHARNSFDKARRVYFAELEATQSEAKATKERLVAEAERLSTSKEWGPTAGAFKRLMDQWRKAGRAGRKDDDALWARFKAAQDAFFDAKDAVAAEEDKEFRANLEVKEALLTEAKALLPIKDLQATKGKLRSIQDRWDAAGKVPRSELGRIEGELRKVEQAVRDAEDARWKKSNPEVNHRASAFAEQIEKALEKENKALERARATGDAKKIKEAEDNLASRRALLEMVQKAQG